MKKTLNLAITMGRLDELYEFHEKFVKEMEAEITAQTLQGNDISEFACTINNSHSIRLKGWKSKESTYNKGKKRKVSEFDQSNKENNTGNEKHMEFSYKKLRKKLQNNSNIAGMWSL